MDLRPSLVVIKLQSGYLGRRQKIQLSVKFKMFAKFRRGHFSFKGKVPGESLKSRKSLISLLILYIPESKTFFLQVQESWLFHHCPKLKCSIVVAGNSPFFQSSPICIPYSFHLKGASARGTSVFLNKT